MNNVYVISVDGDGFDIEVYYIEEETSTMIRARKSKDSLLLVIKDRHEKYRVVSGMRLFLMKISKMIKLRRLFLS